MRGRVFNLKKLSKNEIGYIIGMFVGDGYSYHDKKYRHYSVEFYLIADCNNNGTLYHNLLYGKNIVKCSKINVLYY